MENNFFKKITNLVGSSSEEKEKLDLAKRELFDYLKGVTDYRMMQGQPWFRIADCVPELVKEEKKVMTAIKKAYIRVLKEYTGEAPVLLQKGERVRNKSFLELYKIKNIFELFDYHNWKKIRNKRDKSAGYPGSDADMSLIRLVKDDPDFAELTKRAIISALKETDTSVPAILDYVVHTYLPPATPDSIINSIEVQKAAQGAITNAFLDRNFDLAVKLKKHFNLSKEMLMSPELQRAAEKAIEMEEEEIKKIEDDPNHVIYIDTHELFDLKEKLNSIKSWFVKNDQIAI